MAALTIGIAKQRCCIVLRRNGPISYEWSEMVAELGIEKGGMQSVRRSANNTY